MEIFVGKDILLRELDLSMAAEVFRIIDADRQHLRVWLPWVDLTYSVKETEIFIKSLMNQKCYKRDQVFAIYYHGAIVGHIALKEIDKTNRKTEIGYWLWSRFEGSGIMTESCRALIGFAFQKLGMNKIQIRCGKENYKSIRIPLRLGFFLEGEEMAGEFLNGNFIDLQVFGITKSLWKN